jgi:hypothetical protein
MGVNQVIDRLCNLFTIEKKIDNFKPDNLWPQIRNNNDYLNKIFQHFTKEDIKNILLIFYEYLTIPEYLFLSTNIEQSYIKQLKDFYKK